MIVKSVPPPVFAPPLPVAPGIGLAPPRPWPLAQHPAFENTAYFSEAAIVTCFFNPAGHARPVHNLGAFLDWCYGTHWPVFVAELTFHDAPPLLPVHHPHVIHFRLGEEGVMFQKEALISKLVRHLPPAVKKIFISDADVVPANREAYAHALHQLDDHPLIQPFSHAVWLDRSGTPGSGKFSTAWAATSPKEQPLALDPAHFHPGFCIGVRRSFFEEVGDLYGCPITGTGDTALWQAALAPHSAPLPPGRSYYTAPSPPDYRDRVDKWCHGSVGCEHGQMFHFWHGSFRSRAYDIRHQLLIDFRPEIHLRRDGRTGLPVWTEAGRPFQVAMRNYFASRAEDQ
jgi:hypothetical protein